MSNWSQQHDDAKVYMALHSSFPHAGSGYAVRSHAIVTSLAQHGVDLSVYTRPGFPWLLHTSEPQTYDMQDTLEGIVYNRMVNAAPEHGLGGEHYRIMSRNMRRVTIAAANSRLVHAASDMENGWPAIMAGKDLGLPTVYEYRGMWHYTRASHLPWFANGEEYAARHALELETGHNADAVFAISEALRDDLVEQGLDKNKITILPNAVDIKRFVPLQPDEALKAELGLEGYKVVGFIGSVTSYEGIAYLIDAVLELNAQGERVALMLVGDGEFMPYLHDLHAVRGNHPSIVFTGRVPFVEVSRYYSITDIMAFPRINSKVCQCVPPLKPLEAMAMGKPVIVSDVPALCEMVQHEKTGLICRAGDPTSLAEQLGRLVASPALCNELKTNALEWVRRERDWAVVSKRILQVYEGLLG